MIEQKIAACYIRVSTDEQTDFSPDAQLREIKEYCLKNNLILDKKYIFIDEGISGKTADKRPAFQNMIATAKTKPKPFEVILVHKFDRFARSRVDSSVYKAMLRKDLKIDVVSIKEDLGTDKNGMLVEGMLEVLAEYYSLNLAEEVVKGQLEKVRKGGNVNSMAVGYKKDGHGGMIIDNDNAWWIKIVFEDYAIKGLGRRKIIQHLETLGIKTAGSGRPLSQDRIRYILNNPVYAGYVRRSTDGRLDRKFDSDKWLICKGVHEPIISEDLWNKTQEKNKMAKEMYNKLTPEKNYHWLCGRLVKCSNCGGGLIKYKSRSLDYLQCAHYFNSQCKVSHSIKLERIEEAVLNQLKKDYSSTVEINVNTKNNIINNSDLLKTLESKCQNVENKIKRANQAYLDEVYTSSELKEIKTSLENEYNKMKEEIENIKNDEIKKIDIVKKKNEIKKTYDLLVDPKTDDNKKYELSHLLFDKIIYNRKEDCIYIYYC